MACLKAEVKESKEVDCVMESRYNCSGDGRQESGGDGIKGEAGGIRIG